MTLRRKLLFGSLLVAASCAVYWGRTAVKRGARELWRTWERPDPSITRAVPPAAARPSADGATLETLDPPPYDRPSLLRSGMSIPFGARTLRPNLHFDFETSGDTSRISRAQARSGASSQVIRSGTEYAPAIRRNVSDVADTLTAVAVGLWLYSGSKSSPVTIVTTVDRGGKQLAWFGKEIPAREYERSTWQRFQAEFLLRDITVWGDDEVSIYLWNREKELVYIDDMDVVFRSRTALGRATGTPFDLEDGSRGVPPPPFADVAFHAAIDLSEMGVIVGQTAPEPMVGEVVLTPGSTDRFQYRPGDAVGRILAADGKELALVRAWSPELMRDLLGYERVLIGPGSRGVRIAGFDVDLEPASGRRLVAKEPPPLGAELILTLPVP